MSDSWLPPQPPFINGAPVIVPTPAPILRRLGALVVDLVLNAVPVVAMLTVVWKILNGVGLVFVKSLLMATGLYVPPYPEGEITNETTEDSLGNLPDLILIALLCVVAVAVLFMLFWRRGTSPGKKLFGLFVVDAGTGVRADFGRMFLRESVCKSASSSIPIFLLLTAGVDVELAISLPVLAGLVMVFLHPKRSAPWDLMTHTMVVRRM